MGALLLALVLGVVVLVSTLLTMYGLRALTTRRMERHAGKAPRKDGGR